MSRPRPRWADTDVLIALVIVGLVALALLAPGWMSGSPSSSISGHGAPSPGPGGAPPATSAAPSSPAATAPTSRTRVGGPSSLPTPTAPVASGTGPCIDVPAPRITVVSFNMHSGFNRDRSQVDLERIARELRGYNADVYLLQEVDRNRRWSGRTDQPAYLAGRLGFAYAFGTNVQRWGDSQYGTAILSRYPVTAARNTLLPRPGSTQQRGLLHIRIAPFGAPMSLYVTHLENTSAAAREAQARTIAQLVAADPLPKVLGGDLNATPGSSVLATLRGPLADAWSAAGSGSGWTHPSWAPRMRIDYLLYGGGLEPVASRVIPSSVSDHAAVRTVFEMPSGSPVCLPVVGSGG